MPVPLLDGALSTVGGVNHVTRREQIEEERRPIIFPNLPDRESEYAAHIYTTGLRDQVLFEKGNDHIIDADRCALLAHHQDTQDYGPVHLTPQIATFSTDNW